MSETLPVPADAEHPARRKRLPRGLLVAAGIILVALTYVLVMGSGSRFAYQRPRSDVCLKTIRVAFIMYADSHDGRLPLTLWGLVPEPLTQEAFNSTRYPGRQKGERFDWLYFPKEHLDGLPPDTILIAAPCTSSNSAGMPRRWVLEAANGPHRIPEADFQRLIREQNPPAASASPER